MEVWRRMRASGTPVEADTCNALLTACVECGQGERALCVLRDAQALGAHNHLPDQANWAACCPVSHGRHPLSGSQYPLTQCQSL